MPPISRRDFVATSALGVLGLQRLMTDSPDAGQLLYVGTYTEDGRKEGIFLLRMDPRTGALTRVGAVDAGPNPSFLALHPNGRTLYAVNETTEREGKPSGGVSAFAVARGGATDGSLTRINAVASEGGAPCYVSIDRTGRIALVANYMGGSVALFPIGADGALGAASHVERHKGFGPDRERQEAPHAHCIIPDPTGRWALAADLGIDQVRVYRLDRTARALRHASDARVKAGAGPRHLAFHTRLPILFVANELDSTVTAFRWDAARGTLVERQTISTLPDGWTGRDQVADIHLSPSGRTLYVSNRGQNGIAVFSVARDGTLAREQVASTEGDWPRNFSIDPTGRWLLVANQRSNSIVVLARDRASGRLTTTAQRIEVPSPVCLRFRAHAGVTT
jgi:6-phosphogluconolactonase